MQSTAGIVRNIVLQGTTRTISYTLGNVTVNCVYDYTTNYIRINGSTYDGRRYRHIMKESDAISQWEELDDKFNADKITLPQKTQ